MAARWKRKKRGGGKKKVVTAAFLALTRVKIGLLWVCVLPSRSQRAAAFGQETPVESAVIVLPPGYKLLGLSYTVLSSLTLNPKQSARTMGELLCL